MTEERKYVLRHNTLADEYKYYTGGKPVNKIGKAKLMSLTVARLRRQYSDTGMFYTIMRVTDKKLFEMALKGL